MAAIFNVWLNMPVCYICGYMAQQSKASGNPKVMGSSRAGGKKLAVDQTFSGLICKGFILIIWIV